MKTFEIFNKINGIESYLELGIGNGHNFQQVHVKRKFSVDVNGKADFTGTTNEYFNSSKKKFDLIYIDADHSFVSVVEDYNNSIKRCRKILAIHDLVPPSERYASPKFCGDGYKFLWWLWHHTSLDLRTMTDNFGLTFIKMPAEQVDPFSWYNSQVITYREFLEELLYKLDHNSKALLEEDEILEWLNG